jgi:hypothetical protein
MVDKIFGERLVDKTYYDRVGAYLICLKEDKVVNPVELDHILQWIITEDIETKMYVKAQGWSIRYFLDNHMKI